MEQLILESCHSTWVFDTERMRFRRLMRGIEVDQRPVATDWRAYFGLELQEDSEEFTVQLNESGTRLIRSWRHTRDCAQCGGHVTTEISLQELSALLRT